MSASELKSQTQAKRLFTRSKNAVVNSIKTNLDPDLVDKRFQELEKRYSDVQEKHEAYVCSIEDSDDYNEQACSNWIDEIEQEFMITEKMSHEYIKKTRDGDTQSKIKEEIECNRLDILRDFERIELINEAEKIKKLIDKKELDSTTLMKLLKESQCDLKTQLERCKNAQAQYLSTLERNKVKDELSWTDDVHNIYTDATTEIALCTQKKHLEQEDSPKRSYGLKLQPMPLPKFDGEIREYPRFKDDFKSQVIPSISKTQQAYVLKSCLTGVPLEIVKNVDNSVQEMWQRLDDKYGEPSKMIDVIMNDIKQLKTVKENDNSKFITLVDIVESGYRDLKRLNLEREISNASTVSLIEEKLPMNIMIKWAEKIKSLKSSGEFEVVNKFPSLLEFLNERKSIIEYTTSDLRVQCTNATGNVHHAQNSQADNTQAPDKKDRYRCWLHKTDTHPIQECQTFIETPAAEKIQLVRDHKACWSCLREGHRSTYCRIKRKCNEDNCQLYHNKLLHECHVEGIAFHASSTDSHHTGDRTCLLQLMDIKTANNGKANVLWDGGATLSLITFKKAKELNLRGKEVKLSVTKVGGESEEIRSFKYELGLKDTQGKCIDFLLYGIERISTELESIDLKGVSQLFKGISLKELQRPTGEIDILIGFEYAGFHPLRRQSNGHLVVMQNRFGKCLGGSHSVLRERTQKVVKHVVIHHARNVEIEEFFSTEGLGVECSPKCGSCRCGKCPVGGKNFTIKEERELQMIENGLVRYHGYWETCYPWIKDPHDLSDNRQQALAMLRSTEKRLSRDQERSEVYQEQIEDMVTRDVARQLSAKIMDEYNGPVHYISHHEVIKAESTSTPCRIVFNSSAKCNGYSLNDYWAKGPDLMNSMLGILLRFREGQIALVGDIRKMYHSVHLSLLDQHTHRFLWRNLEVEREPDTYAMTRVCFGDKPAGAIATVALRKTVEEYKDQYPRAVDVILKNTYVDDIIDSFEDVTEAGLVKDNVDEMLKSGGFSIKEWITSKPIQGVPDNSDATINKEVNNGKSKVLGTHWNPVEDQFKFKVRLNFSPKRRKVRTGPDLSLDQLTACIPTILTKRIILSQVNGIYDPLGLLTPFTMKAKVMMQHMWMNETKRLGWDDPLPDGICLEWVQFFKELFDVEYLYFFRCIRPADAKGDPILIIFCDASKLGYGACAYVQWQHNSGSFSSILLCAKGRVAPLKVISIVRLELCGSIIGKRLYVFIESECRIQFAKVIFVIDSQIVQAMIQKESYGFKTFVSVRIGEIQGCTLKESWSWTESENNIADWITRMKSPKELSENSEWQTGPKWLQLPECDWPISFQSTTEELPEIQTTVFKMDAVECDSLALRISIERYSSYKRLLRVTSRVLAMYNRFPIPSLYNAIHELSLHDLQRAEEFWIKDAQSVFTDTDISHRLKRLGPKKQDNGIIVVGQRIEYWMRATYNQQDMILLPYDHRFSRLYVELIHNQCHGGISATSCKVRLKYWILKLEKLVRSVRHRCIVCRKQLKKTEAQVMAPLPDVRLNPAPAWSSTSLDLFGPFETRGEVNKRTRGKAFGVIFNCLMTRAVHIDLVTDYSTDAFLQGFRRFISIRGTPTNVYSDPGSQLQGANNVLQKMIQSLDKDRLKEFGLDNALHWHFTAADAPWQNGCAESLISSCKKAITNAIGTQVLMFSELLTVMYESGNLVNERPIGKMDLDISDGSYLCANDMLLGRATSRAVSGAFADVKCPKRRYNFVQNIIDAFWIKWTRFYFPSLIIRQKWHVDHRNLREGDIVLLQDSNAIRGHWKMAKVSKTFSGIDGKVRKVEVQYKINNDNKNSISKSFVTVERPVQRLVLLLPVSDDAKSDVSAGGSVLGKIDE